MLYVATVRIPLPTVLPPRAGAEEERSGPADADADADAMVSALSKCVEELSAAIALRRKGYGEQRAFEAQYA